MNDEALDQRRRRRWRLGAASVLVIALTGGLVARSLSDDEPTSVGCRADALLGPNGETYGRSNILGCQYVHTNGDPLMFTNQGQPLCYDEAVYVVPCDQPGARPPSADPN